MSEKIMIPQPCESKELVGAATHSVPPRRIALATMAACTFGALAPALAQTSRYPNRAIRIVIPFAAGGTIDAICRSTIDLVSKELGQPMYFDAKPGANGLLGAGIVAAAPPDGYTLLLVSGSFAVNPSIYRKLPYDPVNSFTAITSIARATGAILVAHPSLPANTVKELVALSGRSDLNYSSSGVGNSTHLYMELLKQSTGMRAAHIPYKGSAVAVNAVVANEVQMAFTVPVLANPLIKAGRLKALAISAPTRVPEYPSLPTLVESGVKEIAADGSWIGLFCQSATPRDVVDRLYAAIDGVLKRPAVRESIMANGFLPDGRSPTEFDKQVRTDIAKFAEAVKLAGIQPE
ncbi:MAG: Bug family tripartite tricarboxylate transporter substrate binding protein [Acidovorax temperans]|uniref:Bug family tripartite tricarboxylate transporter substrate binding protein n=1 Tax=Acidovorax temperans TaxID=80878 RepID=UPI00391C20E1